MGESSPPAGPATLYLEYPDGEIQEARLDGAVVRLGRREENDVCVNDASVSGQHAELRFRGGTWTLQDLHSRNGIYVNGVRKLLCVLRTGDVGRVGRVNFRFVCAGGGGRGDAPTAAVQVSGDCSKCGTRITVDDLRTGKAARIGEVWFCPECLHPLLGREIAGHRILDVIDPIGPALLFRAVHLADGGPRALKVFLEDSAGSASPLEAAERLARERFLRESMSLEALSHPGIVRVFDAGIWEHQTAGGALASWMQTPWFAMEFVDGENLQRTVSGAGRMPARRALDAARRAAEALEHAASCGIIHRDVRPANLLLRPDGVVKVIDFGVARILGTPRITRPRSSVGTPGFMAPEQIEDPGKVDLRTDIFGLGATLYFALTGERPVETDTLRAYAERLRSGPLPRVRERVPDLPEELDRVVARALEREPGNRHATWAELRRDLGRSAAAVAAAESGARGSRETLDDSGS